MINFFLITKYIGEIYFSMLRSPQQLHRKNTSYITKGVFNRMSACKRSINLCCRYREIWRAFATLALLNTPLGPIHSYYHFLLIYFLDFHYIHYYKFSAIFEQTKMQQEALGPHHSPENNNQ